MKLLYKNFQIMKITLIEDIIGIWLVMIPYMLAGPPIVKTEQKGLRF
jgi:hypothetical protein